MKKIATGIDIQRDDFVNSLYSNLKKKTVKAIQNHEKLIALAASYTEDGLVQSECIELLMIDGNISREAAEAYVNMVKTSSYENDGLFEYSFQFEDSRGNIISSFDIGKTVKASSDDNAMIRAEEIMQELDADEGGS
jgi:hypothetical protein